MELPNEVFLRHSSGESVGPMPRKNFEVLYDNRVVDEGTPVSGDGASYKSLREWPELLARCLEVKEVLGEGGDPWAEPEPEPSGPTMAADDEEVPILRVILESAVKKVSGHLKLHASDGDVTLTFKDGTIAGIDTNIRELSMERFLLKEKLCDEKQIEQANERKPMMGGDLGGALISIGAVQPHEWFEKLLQWARGTLAGTLTHQFSSRTFEEADVPAPAVPLGMDRLGVALEIVRGLPRSMLEEAIEDKRACVVIPSQVEGVNVEETKLKPKELRVINAVNGVKTVDGIFEKLGGSEDKNLPIYQALYFATQAGFAVWGEDPLLKKERDEAQKLEGRLERMQKQNLFEILGVTEKSDDEEVRTRYTDYAKEFHPDTIRKRAAPELLEIRQKIFTLIGEAFEALETEDQRYKYAHDLERGITGGTEDLQKVQDALHAETLFKKTEVFVRVKKLDEARSHIEEAIALNDQDIEFQIFREYIVYLQEQKAGNAEEAAKVAIKGILGLMKNNANIASGYLYLGHLHKAVNKIDLATKYFSKVLEYDEHHPEATREVRIARMRADKKKKKRWPL